MLRALGAGRTWPPIQRAAHLLWLGWVVFFGVIESGITTHYLLLPLTLMVTAVCVDVLAIVRRAVRIPGSPDGLAPRSRARWFVPLAAALATGVIVPAQWGSRPRAMLAALRPTVVGPSWLREQAAEAPLVACTDELACLLLAGRVDRWLALDEFLRERFVVSRGGVDVGVYAGSPAVYRLSALFDGQASRPARVLVIDVFKDLPVGSSSAFLARALVSERVSERTLLETTSLKVTELREERGR